MDRLKCFSRQLTRDRGPPQIGIDEQHAGIVAAAGERAREVDGRERLAFARRRAGDGDHLERTAAPQPLDRETETLILFRRERSRRGESHEMRVELCLSHVLILTV
jgi:hypothetical protein